MKQIIKALFVSATFIIFSCESLLEIEPRQSIDSSKALTTLEGINSNLANIYNYLKDVTLYGRDYIATTEALADNARIINRAGGRYQNQGTNVINAHLISWPISYRAINEINLLLEALPKANISATTRDEVEGQVRALRTLFYFNLMRAFAYEPGKEPNAESNKGGVPLMLTGVLSEQQIELLPRATQAEVYSLMYDDLTIATAKAPDAGVPQYISKAAAHAIFAKVALYNEDWAVAEFQATEALVLKNTLATTSSYVGSWRTATHPESIFEVLFKNTNENIGVNESVQSAFSTRVALTSSNLGGYGAVVPTPAFLNLFEAGDVRRNLYEVGVTRSGSAVIETTKFMGKTGTLYMDNIPVIRVSEVYLIRAEARAQQGAAKEEDALEDLNVIVARAGLTELVGLTGTALINEIINQRRLELGFEGDRWFDLKRRGADVIKATGNVLYDNFRILAPLPVREIQANTALAQNLGY